jgi:hypothetical protein
MGGRGGENGEAATPRHQLLDLDSLRNRWRRRVAGLSASPSPSRETTTNARLDPSDLADAIAFALRFEKRKRFHEVTN